MTTYFNAVVCEKCGKGHAASIQCACDMRGQKAVKKIIRDRVIRLMDLDANGKNYSDADSGL